MNKLKTLIVAAVIITLNSCYVQHQHSYTQEHTSSRVTFFQAYVKYP